MFYTSVGMSTPSTSELLSHRAIIARANGPTAVGREINVDPNTVKAWSRLDSIPAPHWQAITDAGLATLEELAAAAAAKSRAASERPSPQQAA